MTSPFAYDIREVSYARSDGGETFRVGLPVFRVRTGEQIALVGPSGSGKTTVLDILALLSPPQSAQRFEFCGIKDERRDLSSIPPRNYADRLARLRARSIGYVPQRGGLLPFLNARRNILAGPDYRMCADPAQMESLVRRLGLCDLLSRKPAALSVGEQQRVAICRALVKRPRIVIADEPTAALDADNADRVLSIFTGLARESGVTLIVATHDVARADRYGLTRCEPELQQTKNGGRRSTFTYGISGVLPDAEQTVVPGMRRA